MTDKDPKDMTVSELLRKAGNGYEGANGTVMMNLIDLMGLSRKIRHSECLYALADKIDAELAQARELSLRQGAELWAKANGWPDFRDGEDFGAWLDRCFIPRPRFEDGEPVQFGELVSSNLFGAVKVSAIEFTEDGTHVKDEPDGDWSTSLEVTTSRLKRPAPEVLGADGKPIEVGETVWNAIGEEFSVTSVTTNTKGETVVWLGDCGPWNPAHLTHTPPDTQERIDEDITLSPIEYCSDILELPNFDVMNYSGFVEAMMRDLLRRQRELDKRKGGAE